METGKTMVIAALIHELVRRDRTVVELVHAFGSGYVFVLVSQKANTK